MNKNVSISDLAIHLQLSRNTVSKALNGQHVPEKTRKKVLDAAIELGYKSFNLIKAKQETFESKKVLVLSSRMLMDINYFIYVMKGLETALQENNIELLQYTVSPASTIKSLSAYIEKFNVNGIICIEFFDKNLIKEILQLNIPTVFLDYIYDVSEQEQKYDIVLMENIESVKKACIDLIQVKGCKTFGYIGDYKHCRSFYERFLGMREAMFLNSLPYEDKFSICRDEKNFDYGNLKELQKIIKSFNVLPDCFVCANDSIAITLLTVLKKHKVQIPEAVKIIGFDNIAESKVSSPPLSTIHVDKITLGKKAIGTLIERMKDPSQKSKIIYITSKFVERETT